MPDEKEQVARSWTWMRSEAAHRLAVLIGESNAVNDLFSGFIPVCRQAGLFGIFEFDNSNSTGGYNGLNVEQGISNTECRSA
jgi:hypothetical protein